MTARLSIDEYRSHFEALPGYCQFALYGPVSSDVVEASTTALGKMTTGANSSDVLRVGEQTAIRLAAALTGRPGPAHVVLAPSTSAGILQIAFALKSSDGGEVLVSPNEFPANIYPWVRSENRGGPKVAWLKTDDGRVTPERVAAAITPSTVALAVSAVDYRTGYRADLPGLREVLGDRLLLVDAIQGFGVVDMDWSLADSVVVGGQKWLRSSWGSGFISVSSRALERLGDELTGWTGVEDPYRYDGDIHPAQSGAIRFSTTNYDLVAASSLAAALQLVSDVSVPVIDSTIQTIVDRFHEVLAFHGAQPLVPSTSKERAGIVSFKMPNKTDVEIGAALQREGVAATLRGDHVRLSPHATTPIEIVESVDRAFSTLH